MRICGISIESNKANLVVIEINNDSDDFKLIITKILKIELNNESEQESIFSFNSEFIKFIADNNIEIIGIKKRLHSGKFSGGAISFKIEAIIQMLKNVEVILLPAKRVSSKTKNIEIDTRLFKYQHEAFKTAYTTMKEKKEQLS